MNLELTAVLVCHLPKCWDSVCEPPRRKDTTVCAPPLQGLLLAKHLLCSSLQSKRLRWASSVAGQWYLVLLHARWVRLGHLHPEENKDYCPSLRLSHLHGLVSKQNDHVFWNGRWGDWQAFRGAGCVAEPEGLGGVSFLGQGGSSALVTSVRVSSSALSLWL